MSKRVLSASRFDAYQAVTDKIVQAIEAGAEAFSMPWHSKEGPLVPRSQYVVAVDLGAPEGLPLGVLATYDEWKRAGGQVRHGRRSSTVIRYRPVDVPDPANNTDHVRAYELVRSTGAP